VVTVGAENTTIKHIGREWGRRGRNHCGSWIYNYLCNQRLSPLTLWVRTPFLAKVYSIQQYVIKFVSNLQEVGGFLRVFRFPRPIKLTTTI